ncbi:MAG: response regulator [Anaerolineae bacterium]|jgi:DNA-binding response OmpR family regulator|nr:response regulator [Anaerolineae bacterium]MBT7073134.1 response regulator [Anaerolineae bacterium]MBT7326640.1 response regulator [Anaerolineae bacterium]
MPKVFLAEDDQTMVVLLQTLLGIEGFEVISIDVSAGDLLSVLKQDIPKILLLDVNLPGQSGLDIAREMRQNALFENTRIIMVSGMSLEKESLKSGADHFLLKPYMPDELIEILKKYS